ncbi:hypothetical protein [Methylobacterium sp. SyP6R]|uniref:hypothetical protein n=1 Tax=Methylobacterium sp. SyP6R TaxID=2718876 RepID=UPI001F1D6B52|nr:hypothetical protein [Methylobacterium sp. SyP6R]MCF4127539.1 hypothetical protein [Methylobacterium sp. SyP6R]
MLPATEKERMDVAAYYLSQSPSATVNFLQKVYSEAIIGHQHDVWDVHATDGRWWVITNPTNLYSQDQFPNMDLAVTFHMGLCLRIPRGERHNAPVRRLKPFAAVFEMMREVSDALTQTRNVGDYQAIGVRSREALLAFVAAAQDAAEWPADEKPKRADFRAWIEIICNTALAGLEQKERRRLLKSLLSEAWVFTNWLTHARSATWHDAEAAQCTTEHVLGLAMSLVIRHCRAVPETCPECGSSSLFPEEEMEEESPEIVWERPVCDNCGWSGEAVQVGERSDDELEEIFTRIGGEDNDECTIPTVPLMGLKKPSGE